MIIVTGGAGFIGSNLITGLNRRGYKNILVVDDLSDGKKFKNIVTCDFLDYIDKKEFLQKIINDQLSAEPIEAIFHQGACSTTTEWNGQYLMDNNYEYSKTLLHYCIDRKIPFIYASSAAIYGTNTVCQEKSEYEKPLNAYGYSKLIFDRYVRRVLPTTNAQIVGLRYFNVYGPNEYHKGSMKSVIQHFYDELTKTEKITIFSEIPDCGPGEQRRDFIYVNDVVDVAVWFYKNPDKRGIVNLGTGESVSFNIIAQQLINFCGYGEIRYLPIPEHLRDCYQVFTEADMSELRSLGYTQSFKSIAQAITEYLPNYAHNS